MMEERVYLSILFRVSSLLLLSLTALAQNITTTVSGMHNDIHIDQIGSGNFLMVSIQGDMNQIETTQENQQNGPNFLNATIDGSSNQVDVLQENGSNMATINIDGSGNDADIVQRGDGSHILNLELDGDDHVTSIIQEDDGNHSALVRLNNTGGPWNFNLVQSGSTNDMFNSDNATVNGNCYSSLGCNMTVYNND